MLLLHQQGQVQLDNPEDQRAYVQIILHLFDFEAGILVGHDGKFLLFLP